MIETIPLIYFKPTLCWIDDDTLFLQAANLCFGEQYHCMTFNNPHDAIAFFDAYQSPLSQCKFKREFVESDIFGANNHYPVDINIPFISTVFNIPEKKNEIAVLIVDYNMPKTNGLEICEKLSSLPCKKILLTGEATHDHALDAFNRGLIDKFLKKDHDISGKLNEYINDLIYTYFQEQTSHLVSHIEASRPSSLSDPIFIRFFNTWCQENNVEEFYLMNRQGGFVVKHKGGDESYFIVMNEYDKNEFLKLNDELGEGAQELLHGFAEGKLIPFFGMGKESWDYDVSEWRKYFYPSQCIQGRENYYWAVIASKVFE